MLKHHLRLMQSSVLHHNESSGAKGQHLGPFILSELWLSCVHSTVTTCTIFTAFNQSTVCDPGRPKCGVGRGLEA